MNDAQAVLIVVALVVLTGILVPFPFSFVIMAVEVLATVAIRRRNRINRDKEKASDNLVIFIPSN